MPDEYRALTELFLTVGDAFGDFHGETRYDIEFEFKKIVGEGLVVKQVRRVPGVNPGFDTTPVLIDAPTNLCTFQGEYGDVFANHRLKSRWQPHFTSGPIAGEEVEIYETADHTFVLGGEVAELTGAPSSWPGAEHATFDPAGGDGVLGSVDSWSVGSGPTARTMKLKTLVPTSIGPAFLPIIFPEDLGFTLEAEHGTAVAYLDFDGTARTRAADVVRLVRCPDQQPVGERHVMIERSFAQDGVAIATDFYWPPFPTGAVAGYTAPLNRWIGTTLSGITTGPIGLQGYFSQTYRPEHHNFSENFIFDPYLEPDPDEAVLAELDARGIRAVIVPQGFATQPLHALTSGGAIVELSDRLGQ
jgi:hypothetical protein